jgi:hypothetical protein
MWTCSKCGEEIDGGYEVCWSCGTSMDGVEDPDFFSTEEAPTSYLPESTFGAEVPDRLVTIAQCSLPAQAVAMRLRLEAAGMAVFLADEFTVTMDWLLSNAIGGVKVQVAEPDAIRACELLGIDPPEELLGETEDEPEEQDPGEEDPDEEDPDEEEFDEEELDAPQDEGEEDDEPNDESEEEAPGVPPRDR